MKKLFAALLLASGFSSVGHALENSKTADYKLKLETVAVGLDTPWSLVFLPDGRMLVAERPGQLKIISAGNDAPVVVSGLAGVVEAGQGGLLGLALAPDFTESGMVFYCHAAAFDEGVGTAVSSAKLNLKTNTLEDVKRIFQQSPAGSTGRHFGCRLVFDRAGMLFVTTGDRGDMSDSAQDPATGIGKILRIAPDGSPAPDNPKPEGWDPRIWSMGHRNIQGAMLHPVTGELWSVEHGSKGGDELNSPKAGRNYGWPVISYGVHYSGQKIGEGTEKDGMEQPVHYWDPSIAPSGLMIYSGDKFPKWSGHYFVGALRGQAIARLTMSDGKPVAEERILQNLGERIRDVVQGPDGYIYVLTDSADGQIIRLKADD